MFVPVYHSRVPVSAKDIPSEKEIKARVKAWLRYFVDTTSKSDVARHMGMSLAHISNVYNHPERGAGIRFMVCMHYGLEVTLRELIHEDPPVAPEPRRHAAETKVSMARKRA